MLTLQVMTLPTMDDVQRFLAKIDFGPVKGHRTRRGLCWEWQAGKTSDGYGVFNVEIDGVWIALRAHRVVYELFIGPIPEGLDIDHLCRNRACSNPDHMEPVTRGENTLRSPLTPSANNARKTHCLNGHEFTPENTFRQWGKGGRGCRACKREYQRNWMREHRAKLKAI